MFFFFSSRSAGKTRVTKVSSRGKGRLGETAEGFEGREKKEENLSKEENVLPLSDMYDVEPLTRFGFGLLVYRIG